MPTWEPIEGKDRAQNPDELHKQDIGELRAARSQQGHRFGWVVGKDWQALASVLSLHD